MWLLLPKLNQLFQTSASTQQIAHWLIHTVNSYLEIIKSSHIGAIWGPLFRQCIHLVGATPTAPAPHRTVFSQSSLLACYLQAQHLDAWSRTCFSHQPSSMTLAHCFTPLCLSYFNCKAEKRYQSILWNTQGIWMESVTWWGAAAWLASTPGRVCTDGFSKTWEES